MELAGLVVAIVVCVVVLYAVPARVARRHAVVTSREGDRFSTGIRLIEAESPGGEGRSGGSGEGIIYLDRPSTRPLLARSGVQFFDCGGQVMGEESSLEAVNAESTDAGEVRANPARDMAALKARRAARVSRERAAAKRRALGAAVGVAALVLFTVLAATKVIGWAWLVLPALFLVGTLAASVYGGKQAEKKNQQELDELRKLKARRAQVRKGLQAARVVTVENQDETLSAQVDRFVRDELLTPLPVTPADATEPEVEHEAPSRVEVAETVSAEVEEETTASLPGEDEAPKPAQTWDVIPLPPAKAKRTQPLPPRRVHADTDLVPKVELRGKGVPARPVRKSVVPGAASAVGQVTGPTFRFDLDAVLEQRRAQ